jgi:hypothetical protein
MRCLPVVRYWSGRLLTLGGALLAVVAFFSPWFEVYKLNDPSYIFPRRGFSPWMVIQSGQRDTLDLAAWLFALLVARMALASVELARARTPRRRERAWMLTLALALVGLLMVGLALAMIPFDLSFFWPVLSSEIVYGSYLALAGMLCVIVGVGVGLDSGMRFVE